MRRLNRALTYCNNSLRFLWHALTYVVFGITVYFRQRVVNHAVHDIVVSNWSSGKKSNETNSDVTEMKLEAF